MKYMRTEKMSIEERAESIMLCLNNVCNTGYTLQKCDYDFIDKQIDEIKKEALDAQPVKRGRWIWDSNQGAYKCNNCGYHSDFEENYCYNCGAKMINDGD